MARKKQHRSKQKNTTTKSSNNNQLRIIAGQWRGRKLSFASAPGLRPTPDRVRETLFNWLQGELLDARCLDLFAGSGALGFEAASRGAGEIVMVESNRDVVNYLRNNITLLNTENIDLQQKDAFKYVSRCTQPFDLIFIDPPFAEDYWAPLLATIRENNILAEDGLLYLEYPKDKEITLTGYEIVRTKQVGMVVSSLLRLV